MKIRRINNTNELRTKSNTIKNPQKNGKNLISIYRNSSDLNWYGTLTVVNAPAREHLVITAGTNVIAIYWNQFSCWIRENPICIYIFVYVYVIHLFLPTFTLSRTSLLIILPGVVWKILRKKTAFACCQCIYILFNFFCTAIFYYANVF